MIKEGHCLINEWAYQKLYEINHQRSHVERSGIPHELARPCIVLEKPLGEESPYKDVKYITILRATCPISEVTNPDEGENQEVSSKSACLTN